MSKLIYHHTAEIHNKNAAREILPHLFSMINVDNVLDVGCGTGTWLRVAKDLGVKNVIGIDGIQNNNLMEITAQEFILHDLTLPLNLNLKYDLAICLEVAEHLPEEAADNIVEILTTNSDLLLFSAAIPGQGGQNHINEQWPAYWQEKFLKKGFVAFDILRDYFWDNENIEWWYRQNILIFAKPHYELNFGSSTVKIVNKVHPSLFALISEHNNNLSEIINSKIYYPNFFYTIKLLMKSLFRKKPKITV